jgi:hypothetical protein
MVSDNGSVTWGHRRLIAFAAIGGCCFGLAFAVGDVPVVLIGGVIPLCFAGLLLPIRAGVLALHARISVVRPVLLTVLCVYAGTIPALVATLAAEKALNLFNSDTTLGTSALHVALRLSIGLVWSAAFVGVLVIVVVALLQKQRRRRPLPPYLRPARSR